MIAAQGASGPLEAQFPSYTFPNHYTLVTGLLPVYHGIVSNSFYDPNFGEFFVFTGNSSDPKWWLAEPVLKRVEILS